MSSATAVAKSAAPLDRPPESMRPDRSEIVTFVGAGSHVEIEPGVRFECLVGSFNGARNLTTGLVKFEQGSGLRWHTHPFSESITLLRGHAVVGVEGRTYELAPLDNVVIPRDIAHSARNTSPTDPAVFHIAMATHTPTRTIINCNFTTLAMPASATGHPGAERVNRFRLASRFSAGPNTEFIDFFNRELVPGIEMSGGYGLFYPGGRLPAHVHDFDESISIIAGDATCIVEGRNYALSGCATAMVPRGRVHYFRNDSGATMEMLWVYAGPMPERIVVHERCATIEGDPWRCTT
jgi:quercetin dioxygenase-like cupin family protein